MNESGTAATDAAETPVAAPAPPGDEAVKREAVKREAVKREAVKREAVKREAVKREAVEREAAGPNWGVLALALAALGWLAATLWSAQATIAGSAGNGPLALTAAALALPSVVAASLLAGGAVGVATVDAIGRRSPGLTARALPRLGTAVTGGLVVGGLCAALILVGYGTTGAILVLAGAVGLTAALGAAQAAIPWTAVVGAALTGLLAWFVVGLFQGAYASQLLDLFGAGDTLGSQLRARSSLSFTVAVVGGVVGGLVAFGFLRRRDRGLRWPAYLAAGAGPGLLIAVADLITAVGGAQLFRLASGVSAADRTALAILGTQRLETAEIVLFAGALTALVAFGATVRNRPESDPGQPS